MLTDILFLLVLILVNAFFAASEIALISLNDNKIRIMAEEGNKKAKVLKNLLGEPGRFLATIQIGITLAGFLASAFAADSFAGGLAGLIKRAGIPVPDSWLKNISVFLITIVLSYFSLVLGELVPKRLAMKKAEPISMFVAGPLHFLSRITLPFVKLLTLSTNFFLRLVGINPNEEDDNVTEEEIRLMVDVGEEKGTIHETEKLMINNIFEFNNKTVSEIMTHRTDIAALPVETGLNEVVNFFNTEKYSRVPVYEDSIDNIVGVLYSKSLIQYLTEGSSRDNFNIKDIIKQPYFVPASKRTDILFKELQRNNTHMAVIIDEYGGTAGIVTLEDLIEEIVGNIFDEDDVIIKEIDKIGEDTYIITGTTSLDLVREYLDIEFPAGDYETLSGFVVGQLGRIPGEDENPDVEFSGWVFRVENVDEKRISKIRVTRA